MIVSDENEMCKLKSEEINILVMKAAGLSAVEDRCSRNTKDESSAMKHPDDDSDDDNDDVSPDGKESEQVKQVKNKSKSKNKKRK